MNVNTLIEYLKQFSGETEVFIASDEEGNNILYIDDNAPIEVRDEGIIIYPADQYLEDVLES